MTSGFRACAIIVFLALASPLNASARVFDFKNEHFSVYFGGSFGSSRAADSAFAHASGTGTQLDQSVASATSGEVGFSYSGEKVGLKIGAEYLMPRALVGINGTAADGTALFTLDSKISALIPMANLEIQAYRGPTSRMIVGGGYGIALVSMDNLYTMTSDGESRLGAGSYEERSKGQAAMSQIYVGYEMLFTDTVTAVLTAGARNLQVQNLKSTKATNAISGSQTEEGEIRNMDGGLRTVDLSGAFVGVNFRFYLGF